MKKAFIISGVFISGLIGAGFASGSEILFYFARYSKFGFFGIILSVFIFSLVQYMVIIRSRTFKTHSIDEYYLKIMNKPLALVSSLISYLFMIIIFSAMLSGSGELFHTLLGARKIYGVLFMLLSTHIIVSKGYKAFLSAQSIMSVIIVATILIFGVYMLFFREQSISVFNNNLEWATSAISYSSYNLLTAIAVLCILSKNSDKKSTLVASIFTFCVLFPILIILWYIICIYNGMIDLGAMPLLTIAIRQSRFMGYFYSITLFASILTTAVSNSYTLIVRLSDFINKKIAHYGIMSIGFFLSGFDFKFIVDILYRCVGILSVFILLFIAKDCLTENIKKRFIEIFKEKQRKLKK